MRHPRKGLGGACVQGLGTLRPPGLSGVDHSRCHRANEIGKITSKFIELLCLLQLQFLLQSPNLKP